MLEKAVTVGLGRNNIPTGATTRTTAASTRAAKAILAIVPERRKSISAWDTGAVDTIGAIATVNTADANIGRGASRTLGELTQPKKTPVRTPFLRMGGCGRGEHHFNIFKCFQNENLPGCKGAGTGNRITQWRDCDPDDHNADDYVEDHDNYADSNLDDNYVDETLRVADDNYERPYRALRSRSTTSTVESTKDSCFGGDLLVDVFADGGGGGTVEMVLVVV
eukprot:CAMPEP_0178990610 /NCGR_PEP_ID=MMETSP0795-20121207/5056_1 /TAXON_ID=88552 /ORGANISM="Amoebophrya sp., Strain Ameob2" /LENGTH=221 /DNA_ID=CAMNT_0020682203 /DNA_START=210 /DNA_END=870 /DNA_ORIENTATION=-